MMKLKDYRKKILRTWLFRSLTLSLLRLCFFSWWRASHFVEHDYPDLSDHPAVIYLCWHENIVGLVLTMHREINKRGLKQNHTELYALSSSHPDSRLIIDIYKRYGLASVLGSSARGGSSATKQIISLLKQDNNIVITPDGPRGPVREVKQGAIYIAMKAGVPIIPLAIRFAQSRRMRSWDRMWLPKFGSPIIGLSTFGSPIIGFRNSAHVLWGKPILPPSDIVAANRQQILQELCQQAQDGLDEVMEKADILLSHSNSNSDS